MLKKIIKPSIFTLTVLLMGALVFGLSYCVPKSDVANAADASKWTAGNIIDDSIFYNGNDLSVTQIQQFLDQKISEAGGCDTNGLKTSELGGGTRAQYGASRGYPAPFVCLNGYYESPTTHATNLSGQPIPSDGMSAASIIKNAAVTYNISARALLVIIQKESPGPLLTDTWPFPNQYRNALGYGCPDTAPCDPQYAGFMNQVNNAARQFQIYKNNPANYRNKSGQTNAVLYSPNSACGSSSVYINGSATAGLYNYTPYQPNQAALTNLYGSGDSCSAYGNRNFWRMFNDWFGSTSGYGVCGSGQLLRQVQRLYNPKTFEQFYTADQCEINTLISTKVWQLVGPAFNTTDNPAAATPVYRLYDPKTGLHFWTTNQAEISVIAQIGYKYEGIAFNVVNPTITTAYPVYRLFNPKTGIHFWTLTYAEAMYAVQNAGYNFEGQSFYSQ